jgi:hypothetical protein
MAIGENNSSDANTDRKADSNSEQSDKYAFRNRLLKYFGEQTGRFLDTVA